MKTSIIIIVNFEFMRLLFKYQGKRICLRGEKVVLGTTMPVINCKRLDYTCKVYYLPLIRGTSNSKV